MSFHCFVPGCESKLKHSDNRNKYGITFHKLPANNIDLEIWLKILNCEHLLTESRSRLICSKHFRSYAFTTDANLRRCLRRTATPFLPVCPDNEKMDANQAYKDCMLMKGERDYLFRKLEDEVTKNFINMQSCKVTGKCRDSGAKCPHEEMLTKAMGEIARLNQTVLELTRREAANECVIPVHEFVEATYENAGSETESPRENARSHIVTSQLPKCIDEEPMSLAEDYSHSPVEEQPQQVNLNLVCRWDESGDSSICGEVLPTLKDLLAHVTAHVTDRSDTKRQCCWEGCPMNRQQFFYTASLIRHMYKHAGPGQVPYRCWRKGCGKMFTIYNRFKRHMRAHGRRTITCKYQNCGMKFTGVTSHVVHVRRAHTGERPFGCTFDGCGERFVIKKELNHHVRTHHADED